MASEKLYRNTLNNRKWSALCYSSYQRRALIHTPFHDLTKITKDGLKTENSYYK